MTHTILLLPLKFRSESNTGNAGSPSWWSLALGSVPSCCNAWTQPCVFGSLDLFSRAEQMFQLKAAEGCPWTSDSPGKPVPLSPKSTAAFLQHNAELAGPPPSGVHPAPAQNPEWVTQGEEGLIPIPQGRHSHLTHKKPCVERTAVTPHQLQCFWDPRG